MQIQAKNPEHYIDHLPADRQEVMRNLRKTILANLPEGFEEGVSYGMIGYFVPHSIYPAGYHVDPKIPLPFISLASQKNFIALYHMGIYTDSKLLAWFQSEYPKYIKTKLDMGKSCIRFKKVDQLPFDLIGELVSKMSVKRWIELYEEAIQNQN